MGVVVVYNLPSSLNTNLIDATGAFSISMWINANDISTVQYLFCILISDSADNNVDFLLILKWSLGVGKIVEDNLLIQVILLFSINNTIGNILVS